MTDPNEDFTFSVDKALEVAKWYEGQKLLQIGIERNGNYNFGSISLPEIVQYSRLFRGLDQLREETRLFTVQQHPEEISECQTSLTQTLSLTTSSASRLHSSPDVLSNATPHPTTSPLTIEEYGEICWKPLAATPDNVISHRQKSLMSRFIVQLCACDKLFHQPVAKSQVLKLSNELNKYMPGLLTKGGRGIYTLNDWLHAKLDEFNGGEDWRIVWATLYNGKVKMGNNSMLPQLPGELELRQQADRAQEQGLPNPISVEQYIGGHGNWETVQMLSLVR